MVRSSRILSLCYPTLRQKQRCRARPRGLPGAPPPRWGTRFVSTRPPGCFKKHFASYSSVAYTAEVRLSADSPPVEQVRCLQISIGSFPLDNLNYETAWRSR